MKQRLRVDAPHFPEGATQHPEDIGDWLVHQVARVRLRVYLRLLQAVDVLAARQGHGGWGAGSEAQDAMRRVPCQGAKRGVLGAGFKV